MLRPTMSDWMLPVELLLPGLLSMLGQNWVGLHWAERVEQPYR